MKCPKCKSENVNIQAITEIKNKHHSILYWLFIGWWLEAIMWIFLTLPWLIFKILKPNKVTSKTHTKAICQNCGYDWKV